MKKVLILLLTACLLMPYAACSVTSPNEPSTVEPSASPVQTADATVTDAATAEPSQTDATTEPPADEKSNILVVYFSCTNTTRPIAQYVADGLGADLFEIVPVVPYTEADLNYGNDGSRSSLEMNDPNCRPEIASSVADMSQYDTVFIGYPIWWGEAPRIISTFLESYDFSDKTIIPFCTSGGSGIGSSGTRLAELTNGATWLSGRRFSGETSRDEIIEWLNGLGLGVTAQ